MTLNDEDVDYNLSDSDFEGGDEQHKKLLEAISKLDKRQRVLPVERREPSLQVSEFHLMKESDRNAVHLGDLAKSLRIKQSHVEIARELKKSQKKSKTLPKPLEKPAEERIKRGVAYENVKEQVSMWDPVVFRHRVADHLEFPLKPATPISDGVKDFLAPDKGASELERKMAEVLNGSASVQQEREEEEEEFPLSLEELLERRKEMTRLKVRESYRKAKAHQQNKIKSKKYHRFLRRNRVREQMKEFEELQKKDPEAALERLEEIEKQRVLERASLRHRSTGQWAKNHQVRAKYNRESRQALSEQLRISKDLTQKVQQESDSSDGEEPDNDSTFVPSDNPWLSQPKSEKDVDAFLSGYRKWSEENQRASEESATLSNGHNEDLMESTEPLNFPEMDDQQKSIIASAVVSYSEIHDNTPETDVKPLQSENRSVSISKEKKMKKHVKSLKQQKMEENRNMSSKNRAGKAQSSVGTHIQCAKKSKVVSCGGKWIVTVLEDQNTSRVESLNDMFDDLNEKIAEKASKKLAVLREEFNPEKKEGSNIKNSTDVARKRKESNASNSDLLKMKKQRVQIDIDEELDEDDGTLSRSTKTQDDYIKLINDADRLVGSGKPEIQNSASSTELNPNIFMKAGPIRLKTALPDEITGGEEGLDDSDHEAEDKDKMMAISEAFEDDDVVGDFSQEKQDAVNKSKPEDINLSLPGWGDWAGHNVEPSKRKKRRFIVKAPKAPPRRDENKGNVFINESEDSTARSHQVVDVPFPFTTVKDYEASIRAPVSNSFIPESAHRKLIKPAVRTKMGVVITPMDKEVLVKRLKNTMNAKKKV